MRLHRLVLTNYRGISHREVEFPDSGVTVVHGVNEAGKSSMIEALDLLLESKDRSTKKDVKQVKPTHADVGSEVTAEISCGAYRFIYRKRFHKKHETELTVLAPRREQLTGDEAHERVRAILAETVDTGLWQAQRVLQSASTAAVDVAGSDALSRALDIAAGDAAASGLSGTEPVLIEKIDAEFAKYFTATGRPTGEWAAAIKALQAAEATVAQCAEAVAEVDEKTRLHAGLSADLAELTGQLHPAAQRTAAAQAAAALVAGLREQLRTAQVELDAARATEVAAAAAQRERLRLRADIETRTAAVTSAAEAAADAAEAEAVGRDMVAAAEQAAVAAAAELVTAQESADQARSTVAQLADRDEADKLAARLAKIDGLTREHAEVCAQLTPITLTDSIFRAIERAAAAVDIAHGQVGLIAPRIELTAESPLEMLVGDRTVTLTAGESHVLSPSESLSVRVPGVLAARVDPGATAAEVHTKLVAAQQQLEQQLARGGVADAERARAVDEQRRDLVSRRDQLTARLADLRGDDDVAHLRERLSALRANTPAAAGLFDLDLTQARAELTAAEAALIQARNHNATQQKVAVAAAAQLGQRSTRTQVCQEKVAAAHAELAAAQERLAAQRALVADDDVAVQAQDAADTAARVAQQVQTVSARLADAEPEAVDAELAAARADEATLRSRHAQLTGALRDVTVELAVFGTEGRSGKLDAAQIRREHAASAHARAADRARAANLLRTVMARHRDTTRQRYVDPFRAEIERLGRVVFGPSFEVEIDSDLQILSRTLDGRTVPYESLSGGAKEQLGIVARLAVASLVDKQDAVPVVIDDALGFTDPQRLTKMCEVLDVAGTQGQVIVLTCVPDRYRGVDCAHHIEVSA
jgi:hypothetical protein